MEAQNTIAMPSLVVNVHNKMHSNVQAQIVTCKSLIISNQKYSGTYKGDANVKVFLPSIKAAISYAGITIPDHTLNGVFCSTGNYRIRNSKSAKSLRNGIVHALNKEDINEVHNRYNALMQVMDDFLSYF